MNAVKTLVFLVYSSEKYQKTTYAKIAMLVIDETQKGKEN